MSDRTGVYHTIGGEAREIRIELADDAQVAVYRRWTPAERLRAGAEQTRFVRGMLRSQLKSLYPDWLEDQVQREVARRFLGHAVRAP
ncbi:MAG TPA: hypothetical protein VFX98_14200 [Longimicrobiaceae bacterium]|nr:hypothetical protein [Longimicrobiaceae bacterium]